jgi:hypothetical protein
VAYSGPTEDDIRRLKDIIRLEKQKVQLDTEQAATAANLKSLYGSLAQALQAMLQARIDGNASLNEELDALNKQLSVLQRMSSSAQTLKEINELKISIAEQEYLILDKTAGVTADVLAKEKERIIALREAQESLAKQKQSVDDLSQSFATLITQGVDLRQSLNVDNITKQFGDLFAVLSSPSEWWGFLKQTGTAIFTEMINQIIQMTLNVMDMERGFQRVTGASAEFATSLTDVYAANIQQGISMEEVNAGFQSLMGGYTDFTKIDKTARDGLADTALVLNHLGVSLDDFTKIQQTVTKGMGVSVEDVGQTQKDLYKLATQIGVPVGQMASDFASAGGELSKFGSDGVEVFKDLARTAKNTGLSVNRLLQITSKFDTFEGAAEQAGQLNAALGGNFVNAMDLMMETDPNERFGMIRDSILDAGLSFKDMSYYQKNFYKDAMGLADVGELAMALSGDLNVVNEEAKMTEAEWKELKRRQAELLDVQEQLRAALLALIPIIKPLVEWANKFMNSLFSEENIEKGQRFINEVVGGFNLMRDVFTIIFNPIDSLIAALTMLRDAFFGEPEEGSGLMGFLKDMGARLADIAEPITAFVDKILATIDRFGSALATAGEPIEAFVDGVLGMFNSALEGIADAGERIGDFWESFKGMVEGVFSPISSVVDALGDLAHILFEKTFASTFLEGIGKFVMGMGDLAVEFEKVFKPVETIKGVFESIAIATGNMIRLMVEIPKMIAGINNLEYGKATAFGAAMTATAGAALATAEKGGVGAMTGIDTGPRETGGGAQPTRQPIHLDIAGEPLKKYILEIYGTHISEVNMA